MFARCCLALVNTCWQFPKTSPLCAQNHVLRGLSELPKDCSDFCMLTSVWWITDDIFKYRNIAFCLYHAMSSLFRKKVPFINSSQGYLIDILYIFDNSCWILLSLFISLLSYSMSLANRKIFY